MGESELSVKIGERLRRQRKKMKLTQEEAAELLEISITFYGEIERGKKRISIEKILLAYERMNLDPTYLLTGELVSNKEMTELLQKCPGEKQQFLNQILQYLMKLCE